MAIMQQKYLVTNHGAATLHRRLLHCCWRHVSHCKASHAGDSWWLSSEDNSCLLLKKLAIHGRLLVLYTQLVLTHTLLIFHRKGLNAKQAEFAVKKYKSHRCCGPSMMMSIDVLLNWLTYYIIDLVTPTSPYGNSDCLCSEFTFWEYNFWYLRNLKF